MRMVFIGVFAVNVVATLVSLAVLPDRIAIHFGVNGLADGWAPSSVNALLMTGVNVVLFCSLFFAHRVVGRVPGWCISLPNKDYWLGATNRGRAVTKIRDFLWRFGIATFLFLFIVSLLSIQANLAEPVRLDLRIFLSALAAFLGYTIWWTIRFYRAFRVSECVDQ